MLGVGFHDDDLDLPPMKTCGQIRGSTTGVFPVGYAHDSQAYGVGACTPPAHAACRPRAKERRGRTKMQDSRGGEVSAPDLDPLDQSVQETGEADGAGDSLVRRFGIFCRVP